jgi:hypothetical protein
MGEREIEALLSDRIVERVPADPTTAEAELDVAHRHIATAALVAESDPAAAFAIGYDAIRKAIAAHMRAHGFACARRPATTVASASTRWLRSTTARSPTTSRDSTTCADCETNPSTAA